MVDAGSSARSSVILVVRIFGLTIDNPVTTCTGRRAAHQTHSAREGVLALLASVLHTGTRCAVRPSTLQHHLHSMRGGCSPSAISPCKCAAPITPVLTAAHTTRRGSVYLRRRLCSPSGVGCSRPASGCIARGAGVRFASSAVTSCKCSRSSRSQMSNPPASTSACSFYRLWACLLLGIGWFSPRLFFRPINQQGAASTPVGLLIHSVRMAEVKINAKRRLPADFRTF